MTRAATAPPRCHRRARRRSCSERIMVLDGAMGTAIQRDRPDEAGYRGERFADWPSDLSGNNDLLTLTQPRHHRGHPPRVPRGRRGHHRDQHLQRQRDLAVRLRHGGARLRAQPRGGPAGPPGLRRGRRADPERPRYVAGALGPTTRTASISPDVNDPGARNVSYDQLVAAYPDAARGLVDGGADLLIIETIFDTLNAKAAIFAVETLFEEHGRRWPVIISGTITDASGRTLSGQVTEAFWDSVRHARPLAVGLNCALGATRDAALRRRAGADRRLVRLRATPTPGCPTPSVSTTRRAEETAAVVAEFAASRASSTSSAAAAAPPRPTSRAIAAAVERTSAPRGARRGPAGDAPVRPGAVHRSPRTASSSTSASAPTSPARPVPQPDQGRRLRHRPVGRRAAGRERRAGHRRQHGRGDDRRGRGHGPLPQADRLRARHQPGAGDGRLLQVGGHRGRPQVRAGQADRQLDLHEGGRGDVPRARPPVPQVRRRRGRDGLRRGRPGRQPRPAQGDLRAGLPDPGRRGRLPGRGHHLRPQRLRRRDRHRGARVVRPRLHRGHPLDQAEPPRRQGLRRHLQRLASPSAATTRCARRSTRSSSSTRSGRASTWASSTPARSSVYDEVDPELRERIEDVVLNRRARRRRAAARDRRGAQPRRARSSRRPRTEWRSAADRRADHPRAGQGHRRPRRGRHRGAARRDRRGAAAARSRSSRVR